MPAPKAPCLPLSSAFDSREWWRYYFAGQALAGLLADEANHRAAMRGKSDDEAGPFLSAVAVDFADSLLAALEGSKDA